MQQARMNLVEYVKPSLFKNPALLCSEFLDREVKLASQMCQYRYYLWGVMRSWTDWLRSVLPLHNCMFILCLHIKRTATNECVRVCLHVKAGDILLIIRSVFGCCSSTCYICLTGCTNCNLSLRCTKWQEREKKNLFFRQVDWTVLWRSLLENKKNFSAPDQLVISQSRSNWKLCISSHQLFNLCIANATDCLPAAVVLG